MEFRTSLPTHLHVPSYYNIPSYPQKATRKQSSVLLKRSIVWTLERKNVDTGKFLRPNTGINKIFCMRNVKLISDIFN